MPGRLLIDKTPQYHATTPKRHLVAHSKCILLVEHGGAGATQPPPLNTRCAHRVLSTSPPVHPRIVRRGCSAMGGGVSVNWGGGVLNAHTPPSQQVKCTWSIEGLPPQIRRTLGLLRTKLVRTLGVLRDPPPRQTCRTLGLFRAKFVCSGVPCSQCCVTEIPSKKVGTQGIQKNSTASCREMQFIAMESLLPSFPLNILNRIRVLYAMPQHCLHTR